MPAIAQISSLSDVSPLIPTALGTIPSPLTMRTPPEIQGRSIELGNIDTAAPYRMYETIGAAERNTAQE